MSEQIETVDLASWVSRALPDKRNFREAVHIILRAISESTALSTKMVMKGGMLMAIRYESTRFTKDADFSTRALYESGIEKELIKQLDAEIDLVNVKTEYDTMCKIQSHEVKPDQVGATFPTLKLKIGYAPRSNPRARSRLLEQQSPNVVELDYSYNEEILDVEVLSLGDSDKLQAYSLTNLMAEKFRSILQQVKRNRNRGQDVYDLFLLLSQVEDWSVLEKRNLLDCLIKSAAAREIEAQQNSLQNLDIKKMSLEGYTDLKSDISGSLPIFDEIYTAVQGFYENLPWQ